MTEEKHYFDGKPADVETGIELERFCDVPSIKIKNLNVKNMYITIYQPGCLGGADDE